MRCADAAERLEEGVPGGRTVLQSPGRLVEDSEARVVPLHKLRRADAAVHIRRVARRDESSGPSADAVKPGADWRRRGQRLSLRGLERTIETAALAGRRGTNRFRV